jgi:hypothetical protein
MCGEAKTFVAQITVQLSYACRCAYDARLASLLRCPASYPSFEGETEDNSNRAIEDVVRVKGREFNSDLKIDTIDNSTLARILL